MRLFKEGAPYAIFYSTQSGFFRSPQASIADTFLPNCLPFGRGHACISRAVCDCKKRHTGRLNKTCFSRSGNYIIVCNRFQRYHL